MPQLEPIGIVRTAFSAKYHAPHQPDGNSDGMAQIILHPHKNYEQALRHLEGFERIWVVWWFHQAEGWKPVVQAPRDITKHGVFATRSPHRPNPIGITCCRLQSINNLTLSIADADMLDCTPVLDIKPYIPHYDSFSRARAGWVDEIHRMREAVTVEWTDSALQRCDWLKENGADIRTAVERKLRHNPEPTSSNRIKQTKEGYELAHRAWRIGFRTNGASHITIHSLQSFYTASSIARATADLSEQEAVIHAAFIEVFGNH